MNVILFTDSLSYNMMPFLCLQKVPVSLTLGIDNKEQFLDTGQTSMLYWLHDVIEPLQIDVFS